MEPRLEANVLSIRALRSTRRRVVPPCPEREREAEDDDEQGRDQVGQGRRRPARKLFGEAADVAFEVEVHETVRSPCLFGPARSASLRQQNVATLIKGRSRPEFRGSLPPAGWLECPGCGCAAPILG
jgi:hypothetical protein